MPVQDFQIVHLSLIFHRVVRNGHGFVRDVATQNVGRNLREHFFKQWEENVDTELVGRYDYLTYDTAYCLTDIDPSDLVDLSAFDKADRGQGRGIV